MSQYYPEPIVGAFIFNSEGKLFLNKTHKWHRMYTVPGGHIEVGETMVDALKRECKEETNLVVDEPKFITFWEYIDEGEFHANKHFIFFNFSCKTNDNDVVLNDEAEEYGWFSLEEAIKLPLEKYAKRTIEEYLVS